MADWALDFLQISLERLDALLRREILRLRAVDAFSLDEFRGLYVSDRQVDALTRRDATPAAGAEPEALTRRAEILHAAALRSLSEDSPWLRLRAAFGLEPFELDVVLLALALEADPKYETLYAYLNNDVARKWPTCDLALRLFSQNSKSRLSLRKFLQPEARLFRSGLLETRPAPERSASLSTGFSLAAPASRYLLRIPAELGQVQEFLERSRPNRTWSAIAVAPELREQCRRFGDWCHPLQSSPSLPVIVFEGPHGAGSEQLAEALCAHWHVALLRVDGQALCASREFGRKTAQALALEQRLEGAGIYVKHCAALFDVEGRPSAEGRTVAAALCECGGPLFLAFDPGARWSELLKGRRRLFFALDPPEYSARRHLWKQLSAEAGCLLSAGATDGLAARFALTPAQMKDVIVAAADLHRLRGYSGVHPGAEELFEAARAQSDQSLGKLATRVRLPNTWADLVLPPATLQRAREVAAAIRDRQLVYSQWGFDRSLPAGKGLKILFSGAAGTGKTLTAGIIARELGLDLYKIDLSGIVSKFIGETEKNLERVFHAAQAGNAILFFDEADALFGKRSEVKDAHDRYANIEVAYLLQKMEDHEGAVILASNLSKNMDEAFARRMHYVVDFPLPNAAQRVELWRKMFPPQAPLAADVDFTFLGEQFALAGGDIRNVVLSAAFLAAQNGRSITMKLLIQALARQMVKQGKVAGATEFKQYYSWLNPGE